VYFRYKNWIWYRHISFKISEYICFTWNIVCNIYIT